MATIEALTLAAKDKRTLLACALERTREQRAKLDQERQDFLEEWDRRSAILQVEITAKHEGVREIDEYLTMCEMLREQTETLSLSLRLDERQAPARRTKTVTMTSALSGEQTEMHLVLDRGKRLKSEDVLRAAKLLGGELTTAKLSEVLTPEYGEEEVRRSLTPSINTLKVKTQLVTVARGIYRLAS